MPQHDNSIRTPPATSYPSSASVAGAATAAETSLSRVAGLDLAELPRLSPIDSTPAGTPNAPYSNEFGAFVIG